MMQGEDLTNARSLLNAAVAGKLTVRDVLGVIEILEQQRLDVCPEMLSGEWLLIWTSGTRRYQRFSQKSIDARIKPLSEQSRIVQRLDFPTRTIENEVTFPISSLRISGTFDYTEKKRVQFVFTDLKLKFKLLPAISLPLGNWAKGWLQTTYLDEELHVERGDRGGISIYTKLASNYR